MTKQKQLRTPFSKLSLAILSALAFTHCGGDKKGDDTLEVGTKFTVDPEQVESFSIAASQRDSSSIEVSWNSITGMNPETDVIVEFRKQNVGANFSEDSTSNTSKLKDLKRVVAGLEPSTPYEFRAYLRDGTKLSKPTSVVELSTLSGQQVVWARPQGMAGFSNSVPYQISITWSYDTGTFDGISKLELFKKTGSGADTLLITKTGSDVAAFTSYVDSNVIYNQTYTYTAKVTYINSQTFSVATLKTMDIKGADLTKPSGGSATMTTLLDGNQSNYTSSVEVSWTMNNAGQSGHNGFVIRLCEGNHNSSNSSCSGASLLIEETLSGSSLMNYSLNTTNACLFDPDTNPFPPSFIHVRIHAIGTQGNVSPSYIIPSDLNC